MVNNEMIDIHDVAKIFSLSIDAIRKYKMLGLFEPCKRVGRKDWYDKHEILRRNNLIKSCQKKRMSLNEIRDKIIELKLKKNLKEDLESNFDVKKVLIIEDEDNIVDLLKYIFKQHFNENVLKIYDARTGYSGIESAEVIKPELIILDYDLPDIYGDEVYKQLKRRPNTRNIKVVILSGKAVYQPPGTEYLQKPIEIERFIETVKRLLQIETILPNE